MKMTCTTANGRNGVRAGCSRVTIKTEWGQVVAQFEVPSRQPRKYLDAHPRGQYAQRVKRAEQIAKQLEKEYQHGQLPLLVA